VHPTCGLLFLEADNGRCVCASPSKFGLHKSPLTKVASCHDFQVMAAKCVRDLVAFDQSGVFSAFLRLWKIKVAAGVDRVGFGDVEDGS
jgi:hypothetical protein